MVSTRLVTDDDGRPLLVKVADAGSAAALRHEAEVVAAARHPGVVEVVSTRAAADGAFELVLRWVGSRTAADLRPPVERAAAIAAALAATVADLHALGVRHGRIRPEHVVIDRAGRPVLTGFGAARWASDPSAPAEADDAAGLGEVLRALVGADTELEPIPDARFGRRRSWSGATRRALLTLADQATDDDPARRPTARGLAAAIAAIVPAGDDAGSRAGHRARRAVPARRRPSWRWAAGVVGLGAVAVAISSLRTSAAPFPSTAFPPGAAPAPAPVAPAATAAVVVECPALDGPGADHDGDGCPSPIAIDDGVVALDGVRYAVGRAGDLVAVGDWDCDGTDTVAALRPATGEVFVFDRWAAPDADVVVVAAATVPGATAVEADDPDGDGCHRLVVVDGAGARTEVVPA